MSVDEKKTYIRGAGRARACTGKTNHLKKVFSFLVFVVSGNEREYAPSKREQNICAENGSEKKKLKPKK